MLSIKHLVNLFLILLRMNFSQTDDNLIEDKRRDSLDSICFFSFPNAVVITDDRTIYLFLHDHFWEFDFDNNSNKLKIRDSNATKISEKWDQLPNDIEFGFTIERSSYGNPIAGYTLLVKNGRYYLYRNQSYEKQGKIEFWDSGTHEYWRHWRYVATLRNSSLVLLAFKETILSSSAEGKTFGFDNAHYPEIKKNFNLLTGDIHFDSKELKFLFPLPFGKKYLGIFKTHGSGYYCVLDDLNAECNYEPIHQLFDCLPDILLTKQKDWIYWIWKTFKLNVQESLLVLLGSSFAVLAINVMLFIISLKRNVEMD